MVQPDSSANADDERDEGKTCKEALLRSRSGEHVIRSGRLGRTIIQKRGRDRAGGGAVKKLESIQIKAAIQATGALRTTPSDLLFAHADMVPMKRLIKSLCRRAAIRLATLDRHHPLHHTIQKAAGSYPKTHTSPLHDILHLSKIKSSSLERSE